MVFELTYLSVVEDEEFAVVVTEPKAQPRHEYWFRKERGWWIPQGRVTDHAVEYVQKKLDDPVYHRPAGPSQLRFPDFSNPLRERG